MKAYIDKTALVAELNRLIAELVEEGEDTMFEQGRISAFEDVKVFINHTLEVKEIGVDLGDPQGDIGVKWVQEEPTSNDLEEAADKHLVEKGYLLTTNNGEHLAEVEAKGLFKAGAQWQKEQTIYKACEWLREHKDHPLIGCEDPCLSGYLTDEFIEEFKNAMEK